MRRRAWRAGRFWPETLATPASVSITVDLGLFLLAAAILHCDRVAADRIGLVGLGGALAAFSLWTVGR